jgi:Bacterial SH3 domain
MYKLIQMKNTLFLIFCALSLSSAAQFTVTKTVYTAAKSGLSIREKPDAKSAVLGKIPYGTKIVTTHNLDEEQTEIKTEGLKGFWIKTTYNGKTGYVVSSYLLPVAPPKAGTKTMLDYFKQLTAPAGAAVTAKRGTGQNIHEDYYQIKKQLYKNGFEYHQALFYEANNDTYFLPDMTIEQGFLIVRLIAEFKSVFNETAEFPREDKTIKQKADGESDYTIKVQRLAESEWITRITVEFSDGAYYQFEMFEMGGQLVISFGGGV